MNNEQLVQHVKAVEVCATELAQAARNVLAEPGAAFLDRWNQFTARVDALLCAAQALRLTSLGLQPTYARQSAHNHFLAVILHEIKTPLTSVVGYSQLIRQFQPAGAGLTAKVQELLQHLIEPIEWLHLLVDDLLAHLQLEQLTAQLQPIDLRTPVRRVVAAIQPTLVHHTLTLSLPDTPVVVYGDALRLQQVMANLLGNALKYSPQGGPVAIRATQEATLVRLTVMDRGIGIPQAALPRLFQCYYRVPASQGMRVGGMGLGLHLVRELVVLHGGTIQVTSQEGVGSVFTVCLPLLNIRPYTQFTLPASNQSVLAC